MTLRVPLTLTIQRADNSRSAVSVEAEVRSAGGSQKQHRHYNGKVYRAFTLGQAIDEAGAKAKYADGVLELALPKKAAVQARRISVQ